MAIASKGASAQAKDPKEEKGDGLAKEHIAVSSAILSCLNHQLTGQQNTSTWAKPC